MSVGTGTWWRSNWVSGATAWLAPDLPCDDDSAGLPEYADTVIEAIGERADLVVVAQSLGGFTAPLVCERVPVRLLVLVAPMIPVPGEAPADYWTDTRCDRVPGDAPETPWTRSTSRSSVISSDACWREASAYAKALSSSRIFVAAAPEDTFCWPVTRLPSTTTCVVHGGAASNWAPARRRRSSRSQGALPAKVACVSSSLVKAVSFRPLEQPSTVSPVGGEEPCRTVAHSPDELGRVVQVRCQQVP